MFVARLVLQEVAAVVNAAATALGGLIPLPEGCDFVTIHLDYTNGDEASIAVWPTFLDRAGGIESQWMDWTVAAGNKVLTNNTLTLNATGTANFTFDVRGVGLMRFFEQATGGTPTGLLAATLTLKGS